MKKINKIVSFICLGLLLCGCSKSDNVDTFADVSNGAEKINSGSSSLTIGEVYEYIRENDDAQISQNIVNSVLEKYLFTGTEETVNQYKSLYKKYLNEYFKDKFLDSDAYKFDGEFDEDILVSYLKSESYNIVCNSSGLEGLDTTYFKCDYSDYVSREVNYDIYVKMLKVKYILEQKTSLLDKNKARKISYFSASKDSTYTTRETFEKYISDIKSEYENDSKDIIEKMTEIANTYKTKDLEEIADQYDKIGKADDNSSFTYLQKFTTCGSKRCSITEGKVYQDKLITDKDYLKTEIVIKSNSSVLFQSARDILFGDELDSYLYTVGNKKFLVSPSFDKNSSIDLTDVVVYDGSDKYYLITVDVIDSTSTNFEDKSEVAEMLIEHISDDTVLIDCFENSKLEIYDKQIRDYFISKYGEYNKD